MKTFLTKEELEELTGAKQPDRQRKWLGENGYEFAIRIDGSNVVLRSHLERKLGGEIIPNSRRRIEPDVEGLRRLMNG